VMREKALSVAQVVADPLTPRWIVDGITKLRRENPGYAALLEAVHDIRAGVSDVREG